MNSQISNKGKLEELSNILSFKNSKNAGKQYLPGSNEEMNILGLKLFHNALWSW